MECPQADCALQDLGEEDILRMAKRLLSSEDRRVSASIGRQEIASVVADFNDNVEEGAESSVLRWNGQV